MKPLLAILLLACPLAFGQNGAGSYLLIMPSPVAGEENRVKIYGAVAPHTNWLYLQRINELSSNQVWQGVSAIPANGIWTTNEIANHRKGQFGYPQQFYRLTNNNQATNYVEVSYASGEEFGGGEPGDPPGDPSESMMAGPEMFPALLQFELEVLKDLLFEAGEAK